MTKYRLRSPQVDAIQCFVGFETPRWFREAERAGKIMVHDGHYLVHTPEGWKPWLAGSWLTHHNGTLNVIDVLAFDEMYEKA